MTQPQSSTYGWRAPGTIWWWRVRHPWQAARAWGTGASHTGPTEEPVGPSEYSGPEPASAGLALLRRAALSRNWIHRRVDEVLLEERRTACRSVTLYLTMPSGRDADELTMEDGAILVPLALISKRKLTLFTITDEAGQTLPALTRGERERLCRGGLRRLAAGVVPDVENHPRTLGVLDAIISEPRADARAAIRELDRAASRRNKAGSLRDPDEDALGRLGQQEQFRAFATELAINVLLIAPVRHTGSRLRVLRFSYIEPLSRGEAARGGWAWVTRAASRALRLLGWRAVRPRFETPAVTDAASFHIELEAPPGLQLVDPELVMVSVDEVHGRSENVVDRSLGSFRRVHLRTRPRPAIETAYVRAKLRLRSDTVVRGAFLNAAFATATLAIAGVYLEDLKPPAAAPALLLVAPSLLSLYVGQRLDSPVSTQLAFGAKLLGTAPAVCAFAAAVTAVVASGDEWTGTVWWLFTGAAGAVAIVLGITWRLARWRPERTDVVEEPS